MKSVVKQDPRSLPAGWEERERDGQKYYVDHNTKTTHWRIPEPEPTGLFGVFGDQAIHRTKLALVHGTRHCTACLCARWSPKQQLHRPSCHRRPRKNLSCDGCCCLPLADCIVLCSFGVDSVAKTMDQNSVKHCHAHTWPHQVVMASRLESISCSTI